MALFIRITKRINKITESLNLEAKKDILIFTY